MAVISPITALDCFMKDAAVLKSDDSKMSAALKCNIKAKQKCAYVTRHLCRI